MGDVPGMDGGEPRGIEQVSAVASGEGGEGDRRVRGPVGGGADLARGRAVVERRRDQSDRVDRGRLALVVGRADRGVALDVLDAAHARTGGPEHVGDGLVALQVDEVGVESGEVAVAAADDPERLGDAGRLRVLGRESTARARRPR